MAAQTIFYSSATATQPQAAVSFCASLAARRAHGKLHFNTACPPGRATAPKKQLDACGYCSYSFQIKSLQFHKVSVPSPLPLPMLLVLRVPLSLILRLLLPLILLTLVLFIHGSEHTWQLYIHQAD